VTQTCPITLAASTVIADWLRKGAERLEDRTRETTIRIVIPPKEMLDDRPCVEISIGTMHIRLPTYRGWPLADVSPMGLAGALRTIADQAESSAGTINPHDSLVRRHAHAAVLISQQWGGMPDTVQRTEDGIEVETCLDPDGHPIFWVQLEGGGHARIEVDADDLHAAAGPMPIPCHMSLPTEDGREWIVIGPSMSDEEGIDVRVGRIDPLEAMRMIRAVEERRTAA
jgi:hypothetical protein